MKLACVVAGKDYDRLKGLVDGDEIVVRKEMEARCLSIASGPIMIIFFYVGILVCPPTLQSELHENTFNFDG